MRDIERISLALSTRESQPGQRLAKLAAASAAEQAKAGVYLGEDERTFVQGLATFVAGQAQRFTQLVADAARWSDKFL